VRRNIVRLQLEDNSWWRETVMGTSWWRKEKSDVSWMITWWKQHAIIIHVNAIQQQEQIQRKEEEKILEKPMKRREEEELKWGKDIGHLVCHKEKKSNNEKDGTCDTRVDETHNVT